MMMTFVLNIKAEKEKVDKGTATKKLAQRGLFDEILSTYGNTGLINILFVSRIVNQSSK